MYKFGALGTFGHLGSPQWEYAIEQLAIDLKPSLAAKYQDLIKL
jgi:hypothetical protein